MQPSDELSRRERQIMDIVYRKESASVSDVQKDLPDSPNYSTVRALLRILENKGQLKHKMEGQKYVYYPTVSKKRAVKKAIENLLETFFNNSLENAISALLALKKTKLSKQELSKLTSMIEEASKESNKEGNKDE